MSVSRTAWHENQYRAQDATTLTIGTEYTHVSSSVSFPKGKEVVVNFSSPVDGVLRATGRVSEVNGPLRTVNYDEPIGGCTEGVFVTDALEVLVSRHPVESITSKPAADELVVG